MLGWIRVMDKAACGGTVVEGDVTTISHGQPYTYVGASIACKHGCYVRDGDQTHRATNGRPIPHHGHCSTRGCPLISTLNEIDGRGDSSTPAASAFYKTEDGEWLADGPFFEEPTSNHDRAIKLVCSLTGAPIEDQAYEICAEATTEAGATCENGLTAVLPTGMAARDVSIKLEQLEADDHGE